MQSPNSAKSRSRVSQVNSDKSLHDSRSLQATKQSTIIHFSTKLATVTKGAGGNTNDCSGERLTINLQGYMLAAGRKCVHEAVLLM